MQEHLQDRPRSGPRLHEYNDEREYTADEVRQGEIILKQRWQQIVFIAGLAGAIGLAALIAIMLALHSAGTG